MISAERVTNTTALTRNELEKISIRATLEVARLAVKMAFKQFSDMKDAKLVGKKILSAGELIDSARNDPKPSEYGAGLLSVQSIAAFSTEFVTFSAESGEAIKSNNRVRPVVEAVKDATNELITKISLAGISEDPIARAEFQALQQLSAVLLKSLQGSSAH